MNTDLEQALRDAFEQIGSTHPPTGVGPAVVRRVRRHNRLRLTFTAAAAVVLTAVTVPVGVQLTQGHSAQPAGGSAGHQWVVTAYSGVHATGDASPEPRSLLLDKATGTYVALPYLSALPSPDGTRVLVRTGDDTPSSPLRSGILDPGTGDVRWIGTYTEQGTWSPDGTEILFTVRARLGDNGFAIVDAATLKSTFAKVDFTEDNSTGLEFVWAPGGQEVAITVSHSRGQESQGDPVTGIRFYNRGGVLTHSVPASAELRSEYAFSPRGTQIALHNDPAGDAPARIVDANTGAVQKTVRLSGRNDIVGWADDKHLIVRHWSDDLSGSQLRIVNLAGHVDTAVKLRTDASTADQVVVGSAEDLPPNAAGVIF